MKEIQKEEKNRGDRESRENEKKGEEIEEKEKNFTVDTAYCYEREKREIERQREEKDG